MQHFLHLVVCGCPNPVYPRLSVLDVFVHQLTTPLANGRKHCISDNNTACNSGRPASIFKIQASDVNILLIGSIYGACSVSAVGFHSLNSKDIVHVGFFA